MLMNDASSSWLKRLVAWGSFAAVLLSMAAPAMASEADLAIPDLHEGKFNIFGTTITAWQLLFYGSFVILGTLGISLYQFFQIKKQPAHQSMLNIAEIIYQTCQTYLIQQGKFLLMLWVLIAIAISYYLLQSSGHEADAATDAAVATEVAAKAAGISPIMTVVYVLFFSVVGMGGSYCVALYGIRVNTYANARTAFASLRGVPWDVEHSPAGRHVHRFVFDFAGAGDDGHHPAGG